MNKPYCNKYYRTKPYHFEIPIPYDSPILPRPTRGAKRVGTYSTIEECVEVCKAECKKLGVNYDNRGVMLFKTDADGVWEVTEVGELAG